MRARIYNKLKNHYYISEIYAVINRAGDWYVVDDPDDLNRLCLVEYLDFSTKPPYQVNVEIIDTNPFKSKWVNMGQSDVESINTKLNHSKPLHYFRGYECLWKATAALIELLETGYLDKKSIQLVEISSKLDGWNYIESQQDVKELMDEYKGFHDSVLKELSYVSGDYVVEGKGTILNVSGSKQIKLIFNSDYAKEIEKVLLSPRVVHLIPGEENYLSELYSATIFIKDCKVYFFDSDVNDIAEEYQGTYFVSMGMMWRYAL